MKRSSIPDAARPDHPTPSPQISASASRAWRHEGAYRAALTMRVTRASDYTAKDRSINCLTVTAALEKRTVAHAW
ncbi:hypothetical protein [Paraburkholderia metrosideri]|uniref:hypothetical protein n=1 Tax=Paraburkholderia metrosideri TaxID=580937 RepID=UPI0019180D20|nr:hypothetical protein [Paraburkholderia metrosideri]